VASGIDDNELFGFLVDGDSRLDGDKFNLLSTKGIA